MPTNKCKLRPVYEARLKLLRDQNNMSFSVCLHFVGIPWGASWCRCQCAGQSSGSLTASLCSSLGNTTCAARQTPARVRARGRADPEALKTTQTCVSNTSVLSSYHVLCMCVSVLPAGVCVVGGLARTVCRQVHWNEVWVGVPWGGVCSLHPPGS